MVDVLANLANLLKTGSPFEDLRLAMEAFGKDVLPTEFLPAIEALVDGELHPLVRAEAGRLLRKWGQWDAGREALLAALASEVVLPGWVRIEAQHAVWHGQTSPAISDQRLTDDCEKFLDAVSHLLLRGEVIAPEKLPSDRQTPHTLALLALARTCRLIRANTASAEEVDYLRSAGIADNFIHFAKQGANAVGDACYADWPEFTTALPPAMPKRQYDAIAAQRFRAKPVLSPFSGQRSWVKDSLALDVFRNVESDKVCLHIISDSWHQQFQDGAWYFPANNLLIVPPDADGLFGPLPRALFRRIATALAELYQRAEDFCKYFKEPYRKVAVATLSSAHIGHDLWNVLSAWDNIFEIVEPNNFDIMLVMPEVPTYQSLSNLFPEYHEDFKARLQETEVGHKAEFIIKNNALLLHLRDHYISERLGQRIIDAAKRSVSEEFKGMLTDFQQKCDILLLLTLRLGNRVWVEQEAGYVSLISRLAVDFPRLGIVFDGMNSGSYTGNTHEVMSTNEELDLVNRIAQKIPNSVTILNSIGSPLHESIMLATQIHAYVAPVGAGMAKYRWVANKPGVSFGNQFLLRDDSYDGKLYDNAKFREKPIPTVFVDKNFIIDTGVPLGLAPLRANYSMPWEALYEKLFPLLRLQAERKGVYESFVNN